jgi:glycerophosphoryl diester phosphodiesterase
VKTVLAASSLALSLLASACAALPAPEPPSTAGSEPTLVAHRGGALVYPEASLEAFQAVNGSGFPIEMDLRALADGTLVPLHDETVDRTMTGISGDVSGITANAWKNARIEHPVGGRAGTPTTWEHVVTHFGRDNVLVPELKPGTSPEAFIRSVRRHNVEATVIAQSFDYEVCQELAASGITVLYLLREGEEPGPAGIDADGITHVGPHKTVSPGYLRRLAEQGMTVWPYTVNTAGETVQLLDAGADGVFTDDPWSLRAELR